MASKTLLRLRRSFSTSINAPFPGHYDLDVERKVKSKGLAYSILQAREPATIHLGLTFP
ncbi:hypothetical protein [Mycoavidus cysteinexigens]|uniref:hypothetical protein n=1 Tax=Mycoavidus cysteinexigens TaxID=1553431 RepID=UPI001375CA0A|nr:hypothetical protein [Mycoavidus cysteinexigens]GAM51706.1 hypothetical protein EBME_0169 [bacterium endosymbiont of Mortierella elongata FMR23-6]